MDPLLLLLLPCDFFTLSVCISRFKSSDNFVLWQVGDESDVGDDQLVLQQQVFEEDIFLLQGDGLQTEQANQQLRPGTLWTGCFSATCWLLWKTQRLQDTVLT